MSSLPNSLEVLGRMPCTDTMQIVGTSDFSVLLRPLERYAMAGFPTKVTESMTLGTPVICNLTSDLADYVDDGIEGLVCLDYSVDAFMKTLEGALSLSGKSKSEMRLAARRRAATSFDYRNYLGVMNDFLQNAWSK